MPESGSYHIEYDQENNWLFTDWFGRPDVDTVKLGGLDMLKALKHYGVSKVLNSNIHVTGTWTGASDWAGKVWFPLMVEAGLKHFAWVRSPSLLSNLSAEKVQEVGTGNDIIRFFDTVEEAARWLKTLD